ncbi:MAG: hypothetical protein JO092_11855, partial [Candidatus Eremiobacteraeota bacterium]|nr:hypothetical protein [Candidatus Eremiobacteraeota bacterium]
DFNDTATRSKARLTSEEEVVAVLHDDRRGLWGYDEHVLTPLAARMHDFVCFDG